MGDKNNIQFFSALYTQICIFKKYIFYCVWESHKLLFVVFSWYGAATPLLGASAAASGLHIHPFFTFCIYHMDT